MTGPAGTSGTGLAGADLAGGARTVAVVGGGIAGIAAAWELTGGADARRGDGLHVVVLEASPRLGGKLATVTFDGDPVDVGPDGFLGRRPQAIELCREVGLAEDLVPIGASGAAIWARGQRRPLPGGLFLGVPTRPWPAARSGILSAAGALGLLRDVIAPRPDRRGPLGDRAIGPLVERKLGHQVVERLVDPLVGGIHAGGVADASAAAVFPALLTASQRGGSFMRALRRVAAEQGQADHAAAPSGADPPAGRTPEPAFWAVRGGFGSLVDRLVVRLEERGADLRTSSPATALERSGGRWIVQTGTGPVVADGVVIAVPAGPAAALLDAHDSDAAALLRTIDYASLAVVTLALPGAALPDDLHGTGLLVPQGTRLGRGGATRRGASVDEHALVTAVSYLWAKWPHLGHPGTRVLRASVGRAGDPRYAAMTDDEVVERVQAELAELAGVAADPVDAMVTRWDDALPQYRVHHLLRVATIEAAVRRQGCLAVAGAAYRGVGIPACIESGRSAAREIAAQLGAGAQKAG